jgi:hypothetical protein
MIAKNTICLWYNGDAEEAARFYAETFPNSSVGNVIRAPGDYPAGKQGAVLTVDFVVCGIPCLGLNGGPGVPHSDAFSFQISTEDQAETDRDSEQRRCRERLRLVQRPLGIVMANHAACVDAGYYTSRPSRRPTSVQRHDDHGQNRRFGD